MVHHSMVCFIYKALKSLKYRLKESLMNFFRNITIFGFLSIYSLIAFAESAVILKQVGSPLTITQYSTKFRSASSASRYSSGNPDEIVHTVNYTNSSSKNIVALQIGLASFDAFNGFMGRFSGWAVQKIAASESQKGEWDQRPYAAFSFESFGTGVAYVNAVRFEDGSIWRANLKDILSEMQKFEKDLKAEDLIEKKGK
jgi:hypothetical protein